MSPTVYIVGAGPGDPELLTVRAAKLLAAADIVFHDLLVPGELLATIPRRAQLVPSGHRAGGVKRPLQVLVDAMAESARAGRLVVRLKGGDPYLFGRGAEEAEALLERGVAFELVPGVSSALAAPAAAGIPVTHRELSSSLTVVTGHSAEGHDRVSWKRLATASDTLVVLMGSARLSQLARGIISAGRPAATPAAVVMAATTPEQRQVIATLGTVTEVARQQRLTSPSILIVGEVVSLATALGPALRLAAVEIA